MPMLFAALIIYCATTSRLSGSGFGKQWGVSWLPEALFALPFGISFGYGVYAVTDGLQSAYVMGIIGAIWSYVMMQTGTWYFLRWESHDDPNTERGGKIKPIIDFLAGKLGYKLGDEGYAWIAAGVKGFLIGLPVGGIPLAILWPLGYEIGSHAKGRLEKYGIDPHAISEILAGVGAGMVITLFVLCVKHLIT